MASTLSPRERSLATALAAAYHAAMAVKDDGDDGGSCNLDCAFLHAQRGLTSAMVRRAANAAHVGVGERYRSNLWNGWFVHVGAHCGQGYMRTRMAEAATRALRDAGEDASTYYRID